MQIIAGLDTRKDGPSVQNKDSHSRLNKNEPKNRLLRVAVLAITNLTVAIRISHSHLINKNVIC